MVATRISVAEFEASCGDDRVELIDGDVVPMSPASLDSAGITATITILVGSHVRLHKLGRVYSDEAGFVLFPDRETVLAPDVTFVRASRDAQGDARQHFARFAPDLAVAVISPSDRASDVAAKVAMHMAAGVPLVWLVDPPAQTVTVFALGQAPVTLGIGDELDGAEVLPEFRVAVAAIFA